MKPTSILLYALLWGISPAWAATPTVTVTGNNEFTGRGNTGELLLLSEIVSDEAYTLDDVTLSLRNTTDAALVSAIRISLSTPGHAPEEIGLSRIAAGENRLRFEPQRILSDTVYLRISADISPTAPEGSVVTAELTSLGIDNRKVAPQKSAPASREVLLCRRLLFAPGDYGSRNWRIPALCTLPDGTLLAVNDKRKYNEGDLPEDIDIVARRSTDNGRTWSDPVNVAVGKGRKKGFGDPALLVTSRGEVLCAFVGGNGLWDSTPEDPQRSYISRSSDQGRTWSTPEDITSRLWGAMAANPQCRAYTYSFFGSGNGLTLTRGKYAGRLLVAAAMGPAEALNNHAVYSDDGGRTWQVSDIAFRGGDEAKMVELTDGRILMSVRRKGARGYSISEDGGVTWEKQGLWPEIDTNACNGDMIRYSATDTGGACNLLLHSIPNAPDRRNVSVFCSYDEGKSWVDPRTLCRGGSMYSSLTVLQDGTIGIYVEENSTPEGSSLWFMNFSREWLTRKR